jgi:RNA recognition motif-containing protein
MFVDWLLYYCIFLFQAFKLYGEIEDGNVIVYQDTQKSRRFGYILYKDVKSAQKALRVPSKLIDVSFSSFYCLSMRLLMIYLMHESSV